MVWQYAKPGTDVVFCLERCVMSMQEQEKTEWSNLSPKEKKRQLFLNQKALLDTFLGNGAITRAQYEKSLGDLRELMGMQGVE